MTLDLYQLDKISPDSDASEEALEEFRDALIEQFLEAPESQDLAVDELDAGFWPGQLLYYGYGYDGVTLPHMTAADVEQIITGHFPRKITLSTPEGGASAIPELVAFWQYLKRVYQLKQADDVIETLETIRPNFINIMNDPSKWGMAKSFVNAGQVAGFDMTNQAQIDRFVQVSNAATLAYPQERLPFVEPDNLWGPQPNPATKRRVDSAKKKKRKMEKASRKKNRKK